MRKSRQPRCSAASPAMAAPATPKPLEACPNSDCAMGPALLRVRRGRRADRAADTRLSKACPALEPFKRAALRIHCLIFDLELLDIGRLGLGGLDPLLHLRH